MKLIDPALLQRIDIQDTVNDMLNDVAPYQDSLWGTGPLAVLAPQASGPHAGDQRRLYIPFADVLERDSRKVDIAHCLGGLGLVALKEPDIDGFGAVGRQDYAVELLRFDRRIKSRTNLLLTPGQIGGHELQVYGNIDDGWAHEYAGQLAALRRVMRSTQIFKQVDRMRQGGGPILRRIGELNQPYATEVRLGPNGKPVVVRIPKLKIPTQRSGSQPKPTQKV